MTYFHIYSLALSGRELSFDVLPCNFTLLHEGTKELIDSFLETVGVTVGHTGWKIRRACSPYYADNPNALAFEDRYRQFFRVEILLEEAPELELQPYLSFSSEELDPTWHPPASGEYYDWERLPCFVIADFLEGAPPGSSSGVRVRRVRVDVGELRRESDETLVRAEVQCMVQAGGCVEFRVCHTRYLQYVDGPFEERLARDVKRAAFPEIDEVDPVVLRDPNVVALRDTHVETRLKAWSALVEMPRSPPSYTFKRFMVGEDGELKNRTVFELLRDMLTSSTTTLIGLAADEISVTLRRAAIRMHPMADGVVCWPDWEPEITEQLARAIANPSLDYPIAQIRDFTGFDRRRAETTIALQVEKHDLRAIDGLGELGAAWTAPLLREIAEHPSTPPTVAQHCRATLAKLA